jgi:Gene product 88
MEIKLYRSNDRKVANSFTAAGNSRIKNTFGLPAGREYSCPGATSVCERICYAGKLEKIYKGVKENLTHNWELLKDRDEDSMNNLINSMIIEFKQECDKWKAPKNFRIHWDGDFFNDTYARAWARVIRHHPDVQFWVYTRVESAALILKGIDNLALYFSTDTDNRETAARLASQGVKLAGLHETFKEAKDLLLEIAGQRSAMCPELRGQIPLMGACQSCQICLKGNANITFAITKK